MGVRTIRRRTIRRGKFVADNSAQNIIINFIKNPASISSTSFHQSRFHFSYMFPSIPLPFQQYFSSMPLPFQQCFSSIPLSFRQYSFHQSRFHFRNISPSIPLSFHQFV